MKFINRILLALVLFNPLVGFAASLQAGSAAGDSAAVVANCIAGTNPYGSDIRGCSDDSGLIANPTPSTTVSSASSASYPTGYTAQGWATGTLGTLHGFAQANIPSSDTVFHNLQSHAQVNMQDSVLASSSYGTLYNNYQYTIVVTGSSTVYSQYGSLPATNSFGAVVLDIRNPTCTPCYVNKTLDLNSDTPNGVITGTITGVPIGEVLDLDLTLEVAAGVVTSGPGQSAFAQADYQNTVHFYLDALTPGANTVSTSGYDYATPAVPLPAPFALMSSALGLLGVIARRKK